VVLIMAGFFSRLTESRPVKGIFEQGLGLVGLRKSKSSAAESDGANTTERYNQTKQYRNAYLNVPMIYGVVEVAVDQAVQDFYFEGPNKLKLTKFADKHNLLLFFNKVCRSLRIYGDSFVEIIKGKKEIQELKILDPETMHVFRDVFGKVIGYGQIIKDRKLVLWGSTGDSRDDSNYESRSKNKVENIAHFKYNVLGSAKYGTSPIRPLLPMISQKIDMEADLKTIIRRYIAPIVHAKVGSDQLPASDSDIATVSRALEDIHSENEIATSHLVQLDTLEFNKKGIDIVAPFAHVDQQIISGSLTPPVLLGIGEGADRAIAEVQLRSFGRGIQSLQRTLKVDFEDKIMKPNGLGGEKDKMIWGFVEEREEQMFFDTLSSFVDKGVLTAQKANDLLPPKYHEKLPENPVPEQGMEPKKALDNPTDPTQSTLLQKGRRVTRTDVKSPLDDKGASHKSK
jgi:hypothetical protein